MANLVLEVVGGKLIAKDGLISTEINTLAKLNALITDATLEAVANKGVADGYVPLNSSSKIPNTYLPALAITETFVVASQAAMLGLTGAETGDVAVRTDVNKSFILQGTDYTVLGDWQELLTPTDSVQTVNGSAGTVVLDLSFAPATGILGITGGNTQDLGFTTTDITNWDTGYTYSQVGHLPLTGGTLTGNVVAATIPTLDTHLTNKLYVDNAIAGLPVLTNIAYTNVANVFTENQKIIGTAAGQGLLTVENTVHAPRVSLISNAHTGDLWMDGTGGVVSGGGFLLNTTSSIKLMTDATVRVTLTNGGNVGIGTTNPASKLQIKGASASPGTIADGLTFFTDNTGIFENYGSLTIALSGVSYYNISSSRMLFGTSTTRPAVLIETPTATNPVFVPAFVDTDTGIGWAGADQLSLITGGVEAVNISATSQLKLPLYGSATFTGTATQKLAVTATGEVIEIPIGAGPVDGSGTTNYVTKWIDGDTVGDSNIIDTGTTVTVNTRIVVNGGDGVSQFSSSSDAPLKVISTDPYTGIQFADSDGGSNIHYRGSVDAFYLAGASKLGIGTASPAATLEVAADATVSVDIAHFSNSNGVAKIKHSLDGVGASLISMFDSSNVEEIRLSTQSDSWFNGGNVGIGTTTPTQTLDLVSGNFVMRGSNNYLYFDDGTTTIYRDSTTSGLNIVSGWGARAADQEGVRIRQNAAIVGTSGLSNNIYLPQEFAPTSGTKEFNVLQLEPTVNQTGGANGISRGIYINPTITAAEDWRSLEVTNGNVILASISGNVGIGTATPTGILEIANTIRFQNSTATNIYSYAKEMEFQSNKGSGNIFSFKFGATPRLEIDSGGQIKLTSYGIGTFTGTPAYKLSADSSGNVIETPIGAGAVDGSGTANYVSKWTDADTLGDSQIFDDGTNVGIGTDSPINKLHVIAAGVPQIAGNIATFQRNALQYQGAEIAIIADSEGVSSVYFGDTDDSYIGGIRYEHVGDDLTFKVNNAERARISSVGNFGIGTTTPLSKLHINGGVGTLATGLTFGDGDTGIYESVDDQLKMRFAGSTTGEIRFSNTFTQFGNSGGVSPQIRHRTPTSILPNILPLGDDSDTGIGWAGANELSLIAGGVEAARIEATKTTFLQDTFVQDNKVTKQVCTRLSTPADNKRELRIPWPSISSGDGSMWVDVEAIIDTASVSQRYYIKKRFYISSYNGNAAGSAYWTAGYVADAFGPAGTSYIHIGDWSNDLIGEEIVLPIHTSLSHQIAVKITGWGSGGTTQLLEDAFLSDSIVSTTPARQAVESPNTENFVITKDFTAAQNVKFSSYGEGTYTGTAAYKAAFDASGNVIELPIGAGPVDGSGTTNYVTKWIDPDTIGDSQIFDNGTNVGIGLLDPTVPLEVNTGVATFKFSDYNLYYGSSLAITTESNGYLWLKPGGSGTLALDAGPTGIININHSSYATDVSIKYDTGTSLFSDGTTGNIGIGDVLVPAAALDVDGGIKMADDATAASATNVGTQRYRADANNSYVDMCMQTGAATYAWINITQNNW